MSKYTTEVRFICETEAGYTDSKGFNDVESVIQAAIPHVFNFDFPIFDEEYRPVLEAKILRHYYTREIGLETYGLWKLKLSTKLNEIMPYYNKLYESELLKYNPLYDVDMTTTNTGHKTGESSRVDSNEDNRANVQRGKSSDENENIDSVVSSTTGKRNTEGSGESSTVGSNENKRVDDMHKVDAYSDTPQGTLTGALTNTYLTNVRNIKDDNVVTDNGSNSQFGNNKTKQDEENEQNLSENTLSKGKRSGETTQTAESYGKGSNTSVGNSVNTEDYVLHVFGKTGGTNYARLIKDFRDNLLNIDMDIINDLAELFMLIW